MSNGPIETQLRVAATVAGVVGVVGLMLAAVGIYGVTAYSVSRRTREIGIRLSLGARSANVVGLVLRQGMFLVATGAGMLLVSSLATRPYGGPCASARWTRFATSKSVKVCEGV